MSAEMLKGHLDAVLLATIGDDALHGYAIIEAIRARSGGHFDLPEGTIYPALLRLEQKRWITSEWGTSENNRRARYYRLTATGRKQLAAEAQTWARTVSMINRLLENEP